MPFGVRVSVAVNGERHPLLIGADGIPVPWPNIWLLTIHRNRGKSFGTLNNYAYFLARLYTWAEDRNIPLEERLFRREWLQEWELIGLANELKVQVKDASHPRPRRKRSGGVVEKFLAPEVSEAKLVKNDTAATRLHVVADYMTWLGTQGINRVRFDLKAQHEKNLAHMIASFLSHVPICHNHNAGFGQPYDRKGLLRLLEVTTPGHPENPFQSPEVQFRNHLIVLMLFVFGLRRGELAALKVKDIDLRAQVLSVVRRPDDSEDPRGRWAPTQKTRPRVMKLELGDLIQTYKSKIRNRHDLALKHPYFLVSEQDGAPFSQVALNKMFMELREKVSGLPEKLTPHYLRHAWNYEWSQVCKEKGIPKDEAEQLRKYLMGWTMSSTQAERYNQAYIQERADECSLAVQGRVFSMLGDPQAAIAHMKKMNRQDNPDRGSHV